MKLMVGKCEETIRWLLDASQTVEKEECEQKQKELEEGLYKILVILFSQIFSCGNFNSQIFKPESEFIRKKQNSFVIPSNFRG